MREAEPIRCVFDDIIIWDDIGHFSIKTGFL